MEVLEQETQMAAVSLKPLFALLPILMVTFAFALPAAQPQGASAAAPAFEVASVKPSAEDPRFSQADGSNPGRVSLKAFPLQGVLKLAYGIKAYQIAGPSWLDSQGYDIMAKIPPGSTPDQIPLMLQKLLAERFQLAGHFETRELPILALEVAKDGPKFKESPLVKPAAPAPLPDPKAQPAPHLATLGKDGYPVIHRGDHTGMAIMAGGMARAEFASETMQKLADFLTGETGQPVIDMTGLKGQYNFGLHWVSERPGLFPAQPEPSEPGPNIAKALQQQAGLRLEQRKSSLRILVIDHVERVPTGN